MLDQSLKIKAVFLTGEILIVIEITIQPICLGLRPAADGTDTAHGGHCMARTRRFQSLADFDRYWNQKG
jgi:hypothetical protein